MSDISTSWVRKPATVALLAGLTVLAVPVVQAGPAPAPLTSVIGAEVARAESPASATMTFNGVANLAGVITTISVSPKSVAVRAGGTVTFVNRGGTTVSLSVGGQAATVATGASHSITFPGAAGAQDFKATVKTSKLPVVGQLTSAAGSVHVDARVSLPAAPAAPAPPAAAPPAAAPPAAAPEAAAPGAPAAGPAVPPGLAPAAGQPRSELAAPVPPYGAVPRQEVDGNRRLIRAQVAASARPATVGAKANSVIGSDQAAASAPPGMPADAGWPDVAEGTPQAAPRPGGSDSAASAAGAMAKLLAGVGAVVLVALGLGAGRRAAFAMRSRHRGSHRA